MRTYFQGKENCISKISISIKGVKVKLRTRAKKIYSGIRSFPKNQFYGLWNPRGRPPTWELNDIYTVKTLPLEEEFSPSSILGLFEHSGRGEVDSRFDLGVKISEASEI